MASDEIKSAYHNPTLVGFHHVVISSTKVDLFRKADLIEKSKSIDLLFSGADSGTRTRDLLITNQLLYQLSHISKQSLIYCII